MKKREKIMKIVFAGTPLFAVKPLEKIIERGYEVVGAVVQPDKPQGRKGVLTPPPVKRFAAERGIPVLQPEKLREDISALRALGGDVMITCAYGQILTQAVLDLFPLGVCNIHDSLLPKYRGASPIQSCVLAGETETLKTEIGAAETYGELSERLSLLGAEAVVKALPLIESGNYTPEKQDEARASVVRKITKEQAKIDFSRSADEIVNLVRGMNPEPAAFSFLGELRLNVYRAEAASRPEGTENAREGEILSDGPKQGFLVACKGGAVKLTEVQAAGGKRMRGADFLNGRKAEKGQVFSC